MVMNRKDLQKRDCILRAVVRRYNEGAEPGRWIPQRDVATECGYADEFSPEFVAIVDMLVSEGLVQIRSQDIAGQAPKRIWPTPEGCRRVEYLQAPWHAKIRIYVKENAKPILIGVITTLVAALLLALFGLG